MNFKELIKELEGVRKMLVANIVESKELTTEGLINSVINKTGLLEKNSW